MIGRPPRPPHSRSSAASGVYKRQACGTPVVGTKVVGLQTVIENGNSGLLVPAVDDEALADAIAQVLTDARLRMHLAHGARERAEHFTWRRVGDRIVDLYDRVLDERKVKAS